MATYLVDGHNLAFRAFYGMPELTRSDGFPTGALHGWVRTLWMIEDQQNPARMIVFFDLGTPSRHEALQADYKANRSETPPDMVRQMPYIKRLTKLMGYGAIEEDGVEADDLIAAVAQRLAETEEEACIVSADKDLGQLVGGTVTQLLPPPTANPRLGWRLLDRDGVVKRFGVPPERIPDYLALVGDTSDNIPGLSGVGPKTAAKWIGQYGGIAGILENSGTLKPPRFREKVEESEELLQRNLLLTTLDASPKVDFDGIPARDDAAVLELLDELGMRKAGEDAARRYA